MQFNPIFIAALETSARMPAWMDVAGVAAIVLVASLYVGWLIWKSAFAKASDAAGCGVGCHSCSQNKPAALGQPAPLKLVSIDELGGSKKNS